MDISSPDAAVRSPTGNTILLPPVFSHQLSDRKRKIHLPSIADGVQLAALQSGSEPSHQVCRIKPESITKLHWAVEDIVAIKTTEMLRDAAHSQYRMYKNTPRPGFSVQFYIFDKAKTLRDMLFSFVTVVLNLVKSFILKFV